MRSDAPPPMPWLMLMADGTNTLMDTRFYDILGDIRPQCITVAHWLKANGGNVFNVVVHPAARSDGPDLVTHDEQELKRWLADYLRGKRHG